MHCSSQDACLWEGRRSIDIEIRMAESTVLTTTMQFARTVVKVFGAEYLREPTVEDTEKLLAIGEARGFPDMLGSVDCMHCSKTTTQKIPSTIAAAASAIDDCPGEGGLERITRRRQGKLSLVIPEGRIRPEAPLLAAKFATECNVTVRHHMPVFKRWKDYKDPDGHVRDGLFRNFVGKVGNKFQMDVDVVPVRKACTEMLKRATRQQRYRLKKEFFDPHPLHLVTRTSPVPSMTDEQWNELVESWKDPKKMGICEINKNNRAQVKFHQTTGARSYPVHCDNLGDKYKDKEPTALDLFKECHYSKKKKSYTDVVQVAITEMENKASQPTEDGQESNSATEAVAEVLAKHTKKPRFLQHVGIQHVHARSSAEVPTEKRDNVELRARVDTLTKMLKEFEEARIRQDEEHGNRDEESRKKQAAMDAKLDFLLSQLQPRSAQG
ncbi:uncharacterized protein LOC125554596 [Triticum urartu]|uniref:uncharacterized protein LOC125554596 n=1 Tax=Triticum urartu TaxID=4572 RepID=UPI002043BFFC|nr:uncharacterized protein LOC125554596 [Triticum urartu]